MRENDFKLFEEHFKKVYEEKFDIEIPRDGSEDLTPETKGLQKRRKMTKVNHAFLTKSCLKTYY